MPERLRMAPRRPSAGSALAEADEVVIDSAVKANVVAKLIADSRLDRFFRVVLRGSDAKFSIAFR